MKKLCLTTYQVNIKCINIGFPHINSLTNILRLFQLCCTFNGFCYLLILLTMCYKNCETLPNGILSSATVNCCISICIKHIFLTCFKKLLIHILKGAIHFSWFSYFVSIHFCIRISCISIRKQSRLIWNICHYSFVFFKMSFSNRREAKEEVRGWRGVGLPPYPAKITSILP